MSTSQAPAPTIKNPGFKPATPRKLFVNLPVADVQRSIDFFEGLGFTFNAQFTDASATSMLIGEDAYCMLLNHERFQSFTKAPIGDMRKEPTHILALSADSRAAVDAMIAKAVELGGTRAEEAQDHGFMYGCSFYDLDGHAWEVFWMDPSVVQQG